MNVQITPHIYLNYIKPENAEAIFNIIDKQRSYLKEWLPWVDQTQSVENTKAYFHLCQEKLSANNGFECLINFDGQPVGQIGLHAIDHANKSTSIGYWLSKDFQGKGIVAQSCYALMQHCFDELKLNRIEIVCAVNNYRSNKIPVRLGFRKEGLLKEAEWLGTHFVDQNVYGLVRKDFQTMSEG